MYEHVGGLLLVFSKTRFRTVISTWVFLALVGTSLLGDVPSAPSVSPISVDRTGGSEFSFVVFGDLNGGDCQRNVRFHQLMNLMVAEDAAFYVQTGDLIEGFGTTSCFAHDNGCSGVEASGNMLYQLSPLLSRVPVPGLNSSFFPVIGNHDDNWGSNWYPDPCGDGICDVIDPTDYINHGDTLDVPGYFPHNLNHGDICATTGPGDSGHSEDFFYSFAYQNSYFIILTQNNDYFGMLSCNGGHPGHPSCEAYCSDPSLLLDSARNNNCYNVAQFDWFLTELEAAEGNYDHIFVFAHAPLLTSSWNHPATAGEEQFRALMDDFGVDTFFNGHNHAYERTVAVKAGAANPQGTVYLTTGSAGALTDGIDGDWFTAASYQDWTTYGNLPEMTTYVKFTVTDLQVSGEVVSLGAGSVDTFTLEKYALDPVFSDGFESGDLSAWSSSQSTPR